MRKADLQEQVFKRFPRIPGFCSEATEGLKGRPGSLSFPMFRAILLDSILYIGVLYYKWKRVLLPKRKKILKTTDSIKGRLLPVTMGLGVSQYYSLHTCHSSTLKPAAWDDHHKTNKDFSLLLWEYHLSLDAFLKGDLIHDTESQHFSL